MKVANATTSFLTSPGTSDRIGQTAGTIARQAQTNQDTLMKLYQLTESSDPAAVTKALKDMRLPGVSKKEDIEGHLRQLINMQQQKVNRSFETLTAFQTFMKNIHEMTMAMIRNMRLQP